MKTTTEESSNRIIFLDNLRYFFVLCVVLLHSGNAYFSLTQWWPVSDKNAGIIVDYCNLFIDAFAMPLLFFIAGYFALPSIRKGIRPFLTGKLKRLGIPWIVCTLTICPVLPLIYHYTRDNSTLSMSYLDLWTILMKNFAQFNVGIINSIDDLMKNDQFYQRYMWFISLLLLFFFVFSIIYKAKKRWFDMRKPVAPQNPSVSSNLKLLAAVGSLTLFGSVASGFVMGLSGQLFNPESWFTLANIVQFQPFMLFTFIIYFGMGVVAYRNRWIERGKFPGHFKAWMISFIVLLFVFLFVINGFIRSPAAEAQVIYGSLWMLIPNFLTVSVLGFFSSLAARYRNRPGSIDRNLASNSYNIYLSHYIFVLVFQLALLSFPEIPPLLKFATVSVLSILCAHLASRFLIRPFPKLTVASLFIMLMLMFVLIKP